jgi:hypothetical protein
VPARRRRRHTVRHERRGAEAPRGGTATHCICHGGGDRCQHVDDDGQPCGTSAKAPKGGTATHCVLHGGGNRCQHVDDDGQACPTSAEAPKGGTATHCVNHGGGDRCQHADHDYPPCAIEPYPRPLAKFLLDGDKVCWQHYYGAAGPCRAIRRELVMLGALLCGVNRAMELEACYLGHDFTVKSCQLLRRPDMMFKFPSFGLLLECDENAHRDRQLASEESHLGVIRQWLSEHHGLDRLYVVRVNPDGHKPMFVKRSASNSEQVWEPTKHCEQKMHAIFERLGPVVNAGLDDNLAWIERTFSGTASGESVVTEFMFF